MKTPGEISPDAVQNYINWWQDIGYVCPTVTESEGWLGAASSNDAQFDAVMAQLSASKQSVNARQNNPIAPPPANSDSGIVAPPLPLPETHAALLTYLADAAALPFRGIGRRAALPIGTIDADLCIVTDMPAQADEQTGQLMSEDDGVLLRAMIAAMGLSMEQIYVCSFAPRYNPTAATEQLFVYSAWWRRHVSLLRASHILTLGDQATRLVFGKTLTEMRGRLHDVNHDNGTVRGTASFHPRGLLKKPLAKRQAWQDLQFLMKEMDRS